MEDLAQKLCEAVENEEAKEVESLLKCGADPNFVLPNGIAAIHLASGKENECALRCLKLILQHGGNPNVRSTDDLTPLHVAASWGCCKALIFLLKKGGDASIQDQDGNTALDLALMENNRRCVVALQEHKESISDGYTGCYKDSFSLPDDMTEMSAITLLLESTYENSPSSSTKIAPLWSLPKTVTPVTSNMDYAIISNHVEMPTLYTKNSPKKELPIDCNTKIMQDKYKLSATNAKKGVPFTETLQTSHCSEYFSTYGESDGTLENSSISKNIKSDVSDKTRVLVDHIRENNSRAALDSNIYTAKHQDVISNRKLALNQSTDFQVVKELEGLEDTSLDHVQAYNKEYNNDNEKKTLLLHGNSADSWSKYSGFHTSIWDSVDRRWISERIDNSLHKSVNYIVNGQNVECLGTRKEGVPTVGNELSGISTQMISSERSRPLTDESTDRTARPSAMQYTSQSPTLPIIASNYEHGSHDLQIQLENLLLSAKGCCRTRSEEVNAGNVPESGGAKLLQRGVLKQTVEDANSSSSSSSEDTFIIEAEKYHLLGKEDFELSKDLKEMMLAAKNSSSTSNEDKSPFFTPRTKSRLQCFKFRQNISSLFDHSVEMPKRGRRVRRPDSPLETSTHYRPDKFLPRNDSHSPDVTYEHTKTSNISDTLNIVDAKDSLEQSLPPNILQDHKESDFELQTTINISNFLTDDLSSESDVKSSRELKQSNINHYAGGVVFDSAWLTEDGESEISGVADPKKRNVTTTEEKSLPASLSNPSFLHSTLLEDTTVNSGKVPHYSFSRLSSIVKVDEAIAQPCLSTVEDSDSQEVPLSPGGRPANGSQAEPVEYLYRDNEKGHVLIEKHMPSMDQSGTNTPESSETTIIYDWRNCKMNNAILKKASPVNSPNRVAVELYRLSNEEIASRLRGFGDETVRVTSQNRKMCILLLDKHIKEQTSYRPPGLSFEYSPELSLALHTSNIPDCGKDEALISQEFDQPDKTRKWREGVLKSSFNYLLLDPRVTRNLPSRCHDLSPINCFRTFVSAVFYVGKGKRARPYCHLYEALNHFKGTSKQPCSKVQHIMDIWKSGQGVLSLHCFQNTIPVEAYTREACMVDAIEKWW
ncbi:ankyrin repeat and LEM domain-containing protein 1 isoform 2-T2 [Anomaloglossus baeobatrachus]|uniref:ankyrin repeat and LEM domain-containing protein 1 isoform X2 n=1 Tax=Anomaloglossus baeobatrachus TaxID=238106 RepID=UPI003F508770